MSGSVHPSPGVRHLFITGDASFRGLSRLLLAVPSIGCSHAGISRPCIYCPGNASVYVSTDLHRDYSQFLSLLQRSPTAQVVSLLCIGSFLDTRDVPRRLAKRVLDAAAACDSVSLVTIEAHPGSVSQESALWLRSAVGDTACEVGLGFDTLDDEIRNGVIGKSITRQQMGVAVEWLRSFHLEPVPFVVLQPPGVPAHAALREAESTARFLRSMGVKTAWLEPVRIVEGSATHLAWLEGQYSPADQQLFDEAYRVCSEHLEMRRGGAVTSNGPTHRPAA